MRAACFQFDVREAEVEVNLAAVEHGLRAAAAQRTSIVVLPEMWPTSFPGADVDGLAMLAATERALERVATLSRELDLSVCGSALGRTHGLPANRWHLFDRGIELARYDKVHLFGPTAEDESFSAGEGPPAIAAARSARVGGIVCYDLRFPEVARSLFRRGADVLAVSAQWPSPRDPHFRALAIGRAVEAQAFVLACNRTGRAAIGRRRKELVFPGHSCIVDPEGRVLAEGNGATGLVTADIDLDIARQMRVQVPVAKDERPKTYALWS